MSDRVSKETRIPGQGKKGSQGSFKAEKGGEYGKKIEAGVNQGKGGQVNGKGQF
jgi:Succinyl-CoA synthetase, alpha subunit